MNKKINRKINNLNKHIKLLENKNKKIIKENDDLKNKIKELEKYKYKYYKNRLCGLNKVNYIYDFEEMYDRYESYSKDYKNIVKNKILNTKNEKYKKYNIPIEELIDIFLCQFGSYDIFDLLNNNDDEIENFFNKFSLSDISANNYMSCEGAEPFNDEYDRSEIIKYLLDYFNITSKDIDDVIDYIIDDDDNNEEEDDKDDEKNKTNEDNEDEEDDEENKTDEDDKDEEDDDNKDEDKNDEILKLELNAYNAEYNAYNAEYNALNCEYENPDKDNYDNFISMCNKNAINCDKNAEKCDNNASLCEDKELMCRYKELMCKYKALMCRFKSLECKFKSL